MILLTEGVEESHIPLKLDRLWRTFRLSDMSPDGAATCEELLGSYYANETDLVPEIAIKAARKRDIDAGDFEAAVASLKSLFQAAATNALHCIASEHRQVLHFSDQSCEASRSWLSMAIILLTLLLPRHILESSVAGAIRATETNMTTRGASTGFAFAALPISIRQTMDVIGAGGSGLGSGCQLCTHQIWKWLHAWACHAAGCARRR